MGADGDGFRLLAEAAGDEVFWVARADLSQFAYVSPALEPSWGTQDAPALVDAIHPEDRDRVARTRTSGAHFEHEYRIVPPGDGATRLIWERGRSDATTTVGIARDITERKRVATELERFHFLLRAMKEGMWDWDIVTNRVWWTDAMYAVFGDERVGAAGYEYWYGRIHPDDRERVLAGFHRVLATGEKSWSDEYRLVRADGVVIDVRDRGVVMFDENRKPVRMCGVVMDVTKERVLERQLLHAQKMEALGELAGGIAHDFNNMLQAVTLELSLLQWSPGLTSAAIGHVAEIRAALERATSLTRQLLVFSRREGVRLQRIDISARIVELTRMLRRVLGEDIALATEVFVTPIPAEVDPGMLDQIVLNLALNARDSIHANTAPDARRTIAIATATHDQVDPTPTRPAGHYACITVRDSGTGIPHHILPRIFDPFFTTKGASGTGLGLATVHGIVEQHRGWVDVDTEVGHGSTFRVYLPALRDATLAPAAGAAAPVAHARGKQETILVVEDDALVRRALCQLLESHGYCVIEADCGSSALAFWDDQQGNIDLVFSDLVMPGGMNGRELADRLVALRPEVKIILATGYGRGLDDTNSHPNCKLIFKPIDAAQLLATIRSSLES